MQGRSTRPGQSSVGATAALSGVIFVLTCGGGLVFAGACALLAGLVAGLVNALLIARAGLNPIMVTLGAMASLQGVALWLSRGYPIPGPGGYFEMLGGGFFCYIPLPIIYSAVILLACGALLRRTQFGRDLYALGGSRQASRIADIPVIRTESAAYCMSGLLAAFSGMVMASRLNTGSPIVGQDAPLEAIVAVVLGGASLSGGKGGIPQTVLGLTLVCALSNGLNLMNVAPVSQWGIKGGVLIAFSALEAAGPLTGYFRSTRRIA